MGTAASSLWPDLLHRRMADRANPVLYRFLSPDAAIPPAELTYVDVDRQARAIAATLMQHNATGERVILAHPPGLEFVTAFLGCLYAGATAVPTFPPRLRERSRDRSLDRFAAVLANAKPTLVLTTLEARDAVAAVVAKVAPQARIETLASDGIDLTAALDFEPPARANPLACLQYTSGTSGTPKGVMLTHECFAANSAQIAERFGSNIDSRGVIWLPPHHDMGLMGGLIHPLLVGFECTLMAPATFLQRPSRWLEAVSTYRGSISGGPCFAYALAFDQVGDDVIDTLDLSSWTTAFCGAERVRPGVMNRFADRFGRAEFNRRSIVPCYGMAEATLMITSARRDAGLRVTVSGQADCGPVAEGAEVAVVDPSTSTRCPAGTQGEMWVRSPAVAAGYFGMPEQTASTFAATLADEAGTWLRTGDLGYADGDGFVVTGRLKDVLIVRGVNYAADDLETPLADAHEALQPHAAAAFAVDVGDEAEQVVIVAELRREARDADGEAVARAIRAAVGEACDLEVGTVVLIRPGSIARTTSGKVQRGRCRELFLANELETIFASTAKPQTADVAETANVVPSLAISDRVALANALTQYVREKIGKIVGIAPADVVIDEPLARYGIGSADAVGLAGTISNELAIDLPAMALWDYPTIVELVNHVIDEHSAIARAA